MRPIPTTLLLLAATLAAGGCPVVPADRTTVVQPPPAPTIEPTPTPQYPPPDGVAVPLETGPLPGSPVPVEPAPTTTTTTTTTTTPGPLVIGTPAPPLPAPPPDPVVDPYPAVPVPYGARPVRVTMHGVILPGAGRPAYAPPPPAVIGYAASRMILSNDSGATICRLWLSPAADGVWGNELLGGQWMPPGSELAVSIDPSWPTWDLLAQDCNGYPVHEQRGWPLPSDGVWSIRPTAGLVPTVPRPATPAGPPPPTVVY